MTATRQASFTVHRRGEYLASGYGSDTEVAAMADHYVTLYVDDTSVHVRVQMTGNKRESK